MSTADEREQQIRERLDARVALAEYDKIPVRDLVEGIADGDVDRYANLMESVRRVAWGDYPDNDLAYLLSALAAAREENGRLRQYGEHLPDCAFVTEWPHTGFEPCSCGWAALAREDGG